MKRIEDSDDSEGDDDDDVGGQGSNPQALMKFTS